MSKFVVMLEGSGLLIDAAARKQLRLGQGIRSMGFATTRAVDAPNADLAVSAAMANALGELRSGPLLNGVAVGSSGEPEIKAISVNKVPWWRPTNAPTKGFTFYPEQAVIA